MSDIKQKIISKFGSVNTVARICGVTAGAVSQWLLIPARHQNTLLQEAGRHGVELTPNDFYNLPASPELSIPIKQEV